MGFVMAFGTQYTNSLRAAVENARAMIDAVALSDVASSDKRHGGTGPRNGTPQKWLFRQVFDLIGGPGRTRTCNQTVMSAGPF
jgi:hypothetical protein